MFKNTAGQKVTFLVIDTATNLPKTGDAANLNAFVSIDDAALAALGGSPDTVATEKSATNAPGLYDFALNTSETNGDKLVFSGKSATSGVRVVPVMIYTVPPNFGALSIDSGGVAKANLAQILGTALTETAGQIAAAFKKFFNIATPAATMDHLILVDTVTTYTGNTPQTGDAYARIGANGASLSAIPDEAGVTTLLSRLSSARAGYLDNINNAALATTVAQTGDAYARIGANGISLSAIPDLAGVTTLLSRLSAARAGYLDNINNVALLTTVAQTGDNYAISLRVDSLIELGVGSPTYYRFKATAVEQAPTGGSAPSAATVAAAVWNEARSSHVSAGTFGEGVVINSIATDAVDANALKADAVTEIQSGLSTLNAAGVRTAVGLASANLDTQLDALPTAIENADALLNRDMSSGTDSGSTTVRTPRQALRFIRNKWTIAAGTLSVKKEDDATESWSAAVTGTAGADPVTAVDPAGP